MKRLVSVTFTVVALVASPPAQAQLAGSLVRGQYGLSAGTQAPEGLVTTAFLYDYHTTTLVGPSGGTVSGAQGSLNIFSPGLNFWYVSSLKILGGNYGADLSFWGAGTQTEAPRLNSSQSNFGFGDMYLKPFELGWHTPYVDVITGFALWIPTGSYTPGSSSNTGMGQWGHEFSAGATVWFSKDHHLNLSTQAFYDFYAPKSGTVGPRDQHLQTGDTFTLMGGLGYQLLGGGLNVGVPYFIQWKVTEDTLPEGIGAILPGIQAAKDWSVGLGAEVDLFWSETDGVSARWLQGFAGANTTNGSTYLLTYNHIFYFPKKGS